MYGVQRIYLKCFILEITPSKPNIVRIVPTNVRIKDNAKSKNINRTAGVIAPISAGSVEIEDNSKTSKLSVETPIYFAVAALKSNAEIEKVQIINNENCRCIHQRVEAGMMTDDCSYGNPPTNFCRNIVLRLIQILVIAQSPIILQAKPLLWTLEQIESNCIDDPVKCPAVIDIKDNQITFTGQGIKKQISVDTPRR